MKRGTPDHPKILDLAEPIQQYLKEQQGIDIPFEMAQTLACGIAERLWHYTARYSPDGGIGKHSNSRIARAFGWMYDADWIIEKMTEIKFFDRLEACRIYVHDWHQHSDDAADKWLRDHNLCYANGCLPRRKEENKKRRRDSVKTKSRQSRDKSSQPEPKPEPEPDPSSESKPKPKPKPCSEALAGSGVFKEEISEEMLRDTGKLFAWLIAESLKPNPIIRDSEQNRHFVLAIAERALSIGKKNKCGLFFSLIRDNKRDYATGEWEDRAKARLDEFRRRSRGSPAADIPRPTMRGVT